MEQLYRKIEEGESIRFEPIDNTPTQQCQQIMMDYLFILNSPNVPGVEQALELLKLATPKG